MTARRTWTWTFPNWGEAIVGKPKSPTRTFVIAEDQLAALGATANPGSNAPVKGF